MKALGYPAATWLDGELRFRLTEGAQGPRPLADYSLEASHSGGFVEVDAGSRKGVAFTVAEMEGSDRQPREGCATSIRFLGVDHIVWWGPDDGEADCVATRGGRVVRFESVESALQTARDSGWKFLEEEPSHMDFDPVYQWVQKRGRPLDPIAALNAWNTAQDFAYSLRIPFSTRGRWEDVCYDKLMTVNVPWLFGLEEESVSRRVVRWHPIELRHLRRVMTDAVRVLRKGLVGTA